MLKELFALSRFGLRQCTACNRLGCLAVAAITQNFTCLRRNLMGRLACILCHVLHLAFNVLKIINHFSLKKLAFANLYCKIYNFFAKMFTMDLELSIIQAFEEQIKLAENRIKAFREARKYEENLATIAALQNEKEQLEQSGNITVTTTDVEQANEVNTLKLELLNARRLLQQKKSDLGLITLNITQGVYPTEADFQSLAEFFPEANFKKLLDIERFHNKIQAILGKEFEEAKRKIEEEMKPLQENVDLLQQQINDIKPSMAFSQEFLSAYTALDRRIHKLEDENDAFNNRNRLQNEKKQASDWMNFQMEIILHDIEQKIQARLIEISDFVSEGIDNYPVIKITAADSYSFDTPRNTGTGTNYKGMFFYDLSILQLTNLPAIAHDSLLFPYISDRNICRLLQLYAQETTKQIFIAFDHDDNYGKETNKLLREHMVLMLDAEKEALFDKQWGRKDAPKNENSI